MQFLNDPAARQEPYALLRRLQTEDPVHRTLAFRTWIVTRYSDVVDLLARKPVSIDLSRLDGRLALKQQNDYRLLMMSFRDAPDHDRLRKVINRFFGYRSATALRTKIEDVFD